MRRTIQVLSLGVTATVVTALALAPALRSVGAQTVRSTRSTVLPSIDRRVKKDHASRATAERLLHRAAGLIAMAGSLPAAAPSREVVNEAAPDVGGAKRAYREAEAEARRGRYARASDYAQRSIELASRALTRVLDQHGADVVQVSAGEAPPSSAEASPSMPVVVNGVAPTIAVSALAPAIIATGNVRVFRFNPPPIYVEPFGAVPMRDSLPFGVEPAGPGLQEPYIPRSLRPRS